MNKVLKLMMVIMIVCFTVAIEIFSYPLLRKPLLENSSECFCPFSTIKEPYEKFSRERLICAMGMLGNNEIKKKSSVNNIIYADKKIKFAGFFLGTECMKKRLSGKYSCKTVYEKDFDCRQWGLIEHHYFNEKESKILFATMKEMFEEQKNNRNRK